LLARGIIGGLALGKPLGITLFTLAAVAFGVSRYPAGTNWRHILGIGMLGGIGFTMSIFITNLAFPTEPGIINASKMAILLASLISGLIGFTWLKFAARTRALG
jgi:Na+:H+ antiporter, NhaA family